MAQGNHHGQPPDGTMRPTLRGITPSLLVEAAQGGHLSRSPLLSGLDAEDCAVLLDGARWKRVDRGTTLTLRGSRPSHAWLLLCGFVKEHRALADGTDAVCGFRGPGDLVGETSMLAGRPADNDATMLTIGEVLAVSPHVLVNASQRSERLQQALLRSLATRVVVAEDAVARHEQADRIERVASAVLSLAEKWGVRTPDGIRIGLPLTQAELASWLGVSRETASKALAELRRVGSLSTSRRRLIVHDLDSLRLTAEGNSAATWTAAGVA